MEKCRTCMYWDGPESDETGFARCEHPKMVEPGVRPDGWWISDPAFSFYSGPEFGCVHYEGE